MECADVRDRLPDYLTGSLDELSLSGLEAHWNTCASCRTEAQSLGEIWTGLGDIPTGEPSPRVQARFEAMLSAYQQGLDAGVARGWDHQLNEWIGRWWPKRPVLQLASALALMILGVALGTQSVTTPEPENTNLISLESEVRSLRQLVALSMLDQASASQRLRGVTWSAQIERPDDEILTTLLNTLDYDSSVNVRLAVVDALGLFGDLPLVRERIISSLPRQDSPLVQISLIDLLVELREQRSITVLEELQASPEVHETVRERAELGISEIL